MARDKLTAAEVRHATDGTYNDGDGLNLRVKGASRKWVFRYTREGKVTELGLGSAANVPLKLARKLRDDHQAALAQSLDPRAERVKAAVKRKTFADAAQGLIEARRGKWRANATNGFESSLAEWNRHLIKVCKPIASRLVGDITVDDIKPIVKPYFDDGRAPVGRRLLKRIESVFDYAKAHGWRTGDNPAAWGVFEHVLQYRAPTGPKPHHPALDWREAPAFMARLRSSREFMAHLALELIVLTACRSGEVRGMRWEEVDLDAGVWRIAAERMKRHRAHDVPLTAPAIALLRRLEAAQTGNYVFPGSAGVVSNVAVWEACKRLSDGAASSHGWRSSFRSWCTAKHVRAEIAERILAHEREDAVLAAYDREEMIDARREVLERWAKFLAGEEHDNVIDLAERRA